MFKLWKQNGLKQLVVNQIINSEREKINNDYNLKQKEIEKERQEISNEYLKTKKREIKKLKKFIC